MHLTVIAIIYAVGYFTCFLWLRLIVRNRRQDEWMLLDKIVVMTISLLSWGAIFGTLLLIMAGLLLKIDFNRKCKW